MLFDDEEEGSTDDLSEIDDIPAGTEFPASPRASIELIGHDQIEKHLLGLFQGKRYPHALIFAGPAGIGKSTMAFRLARYLLKTSEDESDSELMGASLFGDEPVSPSDLSISSSDPVFRKVAVSAHPDLLTIERLYDEKNDRRKGEVSVDEIRKIAPFMRKTPSVDNGWRIVIVDDADTMNRNSQNSILKILEEPPEKSLLILVTHRPGALLPTIYSRASVETFAPLPPEILRSALSRYRPRLSRDDTDLILFLAEGSLGRALIYADPANLAVISKTFDLLSEWPKLDWTKIQLFAESLGKGATDTAQKSFHDGFQAAMTALARAKALNEPLVPSLAPLSDIAADLSLAVSLQICDTLKEHFIRVLTGNLDKRSMVMGAFTILENNG